MAYFYGEALLGGLSSMLQQHEGFDVLPGLTFCCLFFALFNTYLEHPMLWTLYDVLDAIQALKHADVYVNFDNSQFEPYLTLYHDKLINYYPGHPIHDQIASAETAYRLQPGKPYID